MKHLPLCIIITISLLACNNKKKNAVPTTASAAEVAETRSESEAKMEELQKLTPYTIAEMKGLLPVELDGDSSLQRDAGNHMGTNVAMASYPLSDTSYVRVSVFDCGGVEGAGIYNMQFINQLSDQYEKQGVYRKLIDFKEGKAILTAEEAARTCTITYFDKDRFLVMMESGNLQPDELKEKAKALKLNNLR